MVSGDWAQSPDIEAVLNYYGVDFVPLRMGWAPVKCPFHEDRIKSASVNRGSNAFTCHACAISGVAIHVVMERENLGYAEACQWAEETFGASDGVLSAESEGSSPIPGMPGTRRGSGKKVSTGGRAATVLGS